MKWFTVLHCVLVGKRPLSLWLWDGPDLGLVYTMQEIGSRSWTERRLTNRIWIIRSLDQCNWLILFPFKNLDQFLASCTQGLRPKHTLSVRRKYTVRIRPIVLFDLVMYGWIKQRDWSKPYCYVLRKVCVWAIFPRMRDHNNR